MKEEFDHFFKSKIAELNQVPGVPYDKEKVWKTIHPRIRVKSSWNFFRRLTIGFILIMAAVMVYNYWPNTLDVQKETIDELPKTVLKKEKEIKTNKIGIEDSIANPTTTSEQITQRQTKTTLDTHSPIKMPSDSIPKKVDVKSVKPKLNLSITENTKIKNAITTIKEQRKAVVHMYRPKRFVGSGLVFKLNGNNKLISKIKNNSHTIVHLNPEFMKFTIGKSELPLVLEAGKIYHLWISYDGFPFGKVELKKVDASFIKANW
ncbi:hypothetical protein KIM67_13975 [Flagellimonas sp. 389]|uniref:hypothetical protein n=1 Tax=Flagellimonas sp. 389 TaxID=2835862 RepID=UPI001BD5C229|nr:hypothetical protein [Flagellimonas sp. 389]MBS9463522.1 hypothetical protein [Flagellimonas sp. 389]